MRTSATFRSGDWRHSFATPSGVVVSPMRAARQYSGPLSLWAQAETWLLTPFSDTAAGTGPWCRRAS